MTADELLTRHPRETLRWLRRRLRLSQLALADRLDTDQKTVAGWEVGRHAPSPAHRAELAALLVPHLATAEGGAFLRELGA